MLCVINRYIRGALRKISGEYNTIRQKVGRVMPAVSHKDWNRSTDNSPPFRLSILYTVASATLKSFPDLNDLTSSTDPFFTRQNGAC
jgi:hypothetical protein